MRDKPRPYSEKSNASTPPPDAPTDQSAPTQPYLEAGAVPRPPDRVRATLGWETIRWSAFRPVMMAGGPSGVLVIIAIQHFDAGSLAKGLIAAAVPMGMLLTPLIVWACALLQWPVSRGIAAMLLIGSFGLALAASGLTLPGAPSAFPLFFLGVLIGLPVAAATAPLTTALWRQNVPTNIRGTRYSQVTWIGAVTAAILAPTVAWYLDEDPSRYQPILAAMAMLTVIAAITVLRIPTKPLEKPRRFPVPKLNLLWQFPLFGYISFAWIFLGGANLITMPLRAEYISVPEYGLAYSPGKALVLLQVLPPISILLSMLIWGWLFDKINFLIVRIGINIAFILSIILFFTPSLTAQAAGSILWGVGAGGGSIAWAMWVTKYAPPGRTADFMAVHTFLTGLRGAFGTALSFESLNWRPIVVLANWMDVTPIIAVSRIAVAMGVFACLLLVPVIHTGRSKPPGHAHDRDYEQDPEQAEHA